MRWNWKYAFITAVIFLIEVCIALYVRDAFIRPFLGDVLVIILLYAAFRTIFKASSLKVIVGVVSFAFVVEFLQYFHLADKLNLADHSVGQIILGSTFDPLDLLAYFLGGIGSYFFGKWLDKSIEKRE